MTDFVTDTVSYVQLKILSFFFVIRRPKFVSNQLRVFLDKIRAPNLYISLFNVHTVITNPLIHCRPLYPHYLVIMSRRNLKLSYVEKVKLRYIDFIDISIYVCKLL